MAIYLFLYMLQIQAGSEHGWGSQAGDASVCPGKAGGKRFRAGGRLSCPRRQRRRPVLRIQPANQCLQSDAAHDGVRQKDNTYKQ